MKLKSFFMVMATTGLILSCTPTEQKSDVDSKNLGEAIGKSKM